MGFKFRVIDFAQPELAAGFNSLMAEKPGLWDRVEKPLGAFVGIAFDLHELNRLHAEICEYTRVVKICERERLVPINLGDAVHFTMNESHKFEK